MSTLKLPDHIDQYFKDHSLKIMDDEIDSLVEWLIPNIPGKVFFDVGAHIGVWSIIAVLNGAREIHLFEPERQRLITAYQNVQRAGAKSIFLNDKVIWGMNGSQPYDNWHAGGSGDQRDTQTLDSYVRFDGFRVITGDSIIPPGSYPVEWESGTVIADLIKYKSNPKMMEDVPKRETESLDYYGFAPDFIKIDTEGAELEVLNGAQELIKKHHPMLMVENHGDAGRDKDIIGLVGEGYKLMDPIREWGNHRHLFFKYQ